ncbi:MAG: sulfite exporter TauE/SafE family protein [Planctomycetia bacterium]|nr:sulfite exporter TauE/SafE family protein [Planctomycetia bacterium]
METFSWLSLAALGAGAINALAGGGTLLTFPALQAVVGSVTANATSSVALMPGSLASAWGYRREIRQSAGHLLLLMVPSLIGGGVGSLLLILLPESVFDALVPWLILSASVLFLMQPVVVKLLPKRDENAPRPTRTAVGVALCQFVVAVYGGYFGAGMGILMLSTLSFMNYANIHEINAIKSLLAACINAVAVVIFIVDGRVAWTYGLPMTIATVLGGYLGAVLARRMNVRAVRWLVIVIGFGLSAYYFLK